MAAPQQDYQARSRAGLLRKAVRPKLPARLLLMAPSGAGKTWSSLSIGTELAGEDGQLIVIDTEQQQGEHTASETYADAFDFQFIPWSGGQFDIRDLTATLNDLATTVAEDDVLIIDGISPFWEGPGGILSMVEGVFGTWAKVRPIEARMLEAIKTFPAHVILTVREKLVWNVQEYEDERGRKRTKVDMGGMGPKFNKDIIYEMNVAASMDHSHGLTVVKSRATTLSDRTYGPEQEKVFANALKDWLGSGRPLATAEQQTEIVARFAMIDDKDDRTNFKKEFVSKFGLPADLLEEDLVVALGWLDTELDSYTKAAEEEAKEAQEKADIEAKVEAAKQAAAAKLSETPDQIDYVVEDNTDYSMTTEGGEDE